MSDDFQQRYADHFNRKAHSDARTIAALRLELARCKRALASSRATLAAERHPDPAEGGTEVRTTFGLASLRRPSPFLASPGYTP